jgi:Fe-S-cluster-containing dehydrogenase component/DMSO reductase anchor subunit
MPGRAPRPGEQYRFHFDMAKCIGCKCCVVACNEQNGNPASINWRRVGEIEGGVYPLAQRWHISMGCNQCLEPACLIGCPVEAYTKDMATGIVDHDPDICIGCQYCTWNCSYGVPQYNPARGVVGKCDMCHGRLDQGLMPACVNACPEGAIAIEVVSIAHWRRSHADADAPGMPTSSDTLSTTRITLPEKLAAGVQRVDFERVRPEEPHWSLVLLLVLSQLAVGAASALWLLSLSGAVLAPWAALAPLAAAIAALAVAPLHLGRPAYAYRAMKNWRRSWLSREVLALTVFAGAATAFAGSLLLRLPWTPWLGSAAFVSGFLAVTASARIYMVPARPAWNLRFTLSDFFLTCAVLGPRLVLAAGLGRGPWLIAFAVAASLVQYGNQLARIAILARSSVPELRTSYELLCHDLHPILAARLVCTVLALVLVALAPVVACLLALAGELLGRYLFFTGVVPKSVASTYLTPKEAAAA